MAPDVVLERRDVEVADQDRAARGARLAPNHARHLVEESELVGEFRVERGVGLVAAGGDVEIVDLEPRRLAGERHRDVAAIALVAEVARRSSGNGRRETIATP